MITKDDMELFLRVVESGSFSAAATYLDSSRSLISKRILALERRLGVRLLNRTTRRLSLTESGELYLDYCRSVVRLREEAEQRIGEMGRSPQGRLRVTMPITFGQLHIAPLLPEFMARYPGIQLDIEAQDGFVDLVASGLDVAIRIGILDDSGLFARQIATTRLIAAASPAYLKQRGTPASPAELRHHNCLTYRHARDRSSTWRFHGEGKPLVVPVSGTLRADNGLVLMNAAIAGAGIIFLPEFMIRQPLREGTLVALFPNLAGEELGIYTVHAHRPPTPPKIRAFNDFLREKLADYPGTGVRTADGAETRMRG
ncbi:MAG: LysR family transcriptional regulator [Gammaproteobacteria bacterium]